MRIKALAILPSGDYGVSDYCTGDSDDGNDGSGGRGEGCNEHIGNYGAGDKFLRF